MTPRVGIRICVVGGERLCSTISTWKSEDVPSTQQADTSGVSYSVFSWENGLQIYLGVPNPSVRSIT
jgi:hypothetical protein